MKKFFLVSLGILVGHTIALAQTNMQPILEKSKSSTSSIRKCRLTCRFVTNTEKP